jgi:hypothetical protein
MGGAQAPAGRSSPNPESRRSYVGIAWTCAAVAFFGFTPTYWAPVVRRTFSAPPIVVQARLAASGRYERHRTLGYAGIALATAMLFAGVMIAIAGVRTGIDRGYGDAARAFSIVPLTIVVTFAAAVGVALANVRRPEVHMRMMVVASVSLLPPALARVVVLLAAPPGAGVGFGYPPPPIALSLVPSVLADLLLVVPLVRDWRERGRPHLAYTISAAVLVITQVARVPFAQTGAWHAVTSWLLRFGG